MPLIDGLSVGQRGCREDMDGNGTSLPASLPRPTTAAIYLLPYLLILPDYYRVTVARKSAAAKRVHRVDRGPVIFGTSSEHNPAGPAVLPPHPLATLAPWL